MAYSIPWVTFLSSIQTNSFLIECDIDSYFYCWFQTIPSIPLYLLNPMVLPLESSLNQSHLLPFHWFWSSCIVLRSIHSYSIYCLLNCLPKCTFLWISLSPIDVDRMVQSLFPILHKTLLPLDFWNWSWNPSLVLV